MRFKKKEAFSPSKLTAKKE